MGGGHALGPGQRGDAVAVAIQAEGARRPVDTHHRGVVGDVGVHPLGEVIQQGIDPAGGVDFRQDHRIRRVHRRVDRLEIVDLRLAAKQQNRLGRGQDDQGRHHRGAAGADGHEQGAGGERDQQQGHQAEGVDQMHGQQHAGRAQGGAGQVEAIDQPDAAALQDEAQADEDACQEEERQQGKVILGDVPDLPLPRRGILQLQRVEGVHRRQMEAGRRRRDQGGGQPGHQPVGVADEGIPVDRQHDAAQREADHHDRNDPVAVFRPFRDGEVADQRGLVPDRAQRHEEQRDQVHGQTRRRMNASTTALKRVASSTNSAWPAS